jgi:hypothetical protein
MTAVLTLAISGTPRGTQSPFRRLRETRPDAVAPDLRRRGKLGAICHQRLYALLSRKLLPQGESASVPRFRVTGPRFTARLTNFKVMISFSTFSSVSLSSHFASSLHLCLPFFSFETHRSQGSGYHNIRRHIPQTSILHCLSLSQKCIK